MKIYAPKPDKYGEGGGFTCEEIQQGKHWLYTDVECVDCGKVMPLAVAGSTDNGKCIRCGGRTT